MINALFNILGTITVFAEGEVGAPSGPAALLGSIGPLVLMLAVFYFILIMPQRKKEKQQKAMIAAVKMSDEIVTIGGIHGKIVRIKDDTIVIESGAGTQKSFIRIERSAISRLTKEGSGKEKPMPVPDFEDASEEETE